jgi:hypothetical protein
MITMSRQAQRQYEFCLDAIMRRKKAHRTYQRTLSMLWSIPGTDRARARLIAEFAAYKERRHGRHTTV